MPAESIFTVTKIQRPNLMSFVGNLSVEQSIKIFMFVHHHGVMIHFTGRTKDRYVLYRIIYHLHFLFASFFTPFGGALTFTLGHDGKTLKEEG